MPTFNMQDKLAVMAQADVAVTINGQVFTVPAATPFTTQRATIDVDVGTVFAIMYGVQATNGEPIQVFSVDEIVTVT